MVQIKTQHSLIMSNFQIKKFITVDECVSTKQCVISLMEECQIQMKFCLKDQ